MIRYGACEDWRERTGLDSQLAKQFGIYHIELGVVQLCIGEKRKLQIPPHLGYGDMSMGDIIPAGSTLVFDVELVDIDGKRVRAIREPRNEL